MEKVIKDPKNEKHLPLIKAAFGDKADLTVVKENIEKIKNGNVPVKLRTDEDDTIAYTFYKNKKNPMVPQHVVFGPQYYDGV